MQDEQVQAVLSSTDVKIWQGMEISETLLTTCKDTIQKKALCLTTGFLDYRINPYIALLHPSDIRMDRTDIISKSVLRTVFVCCAKHFYFLNHDI